MVRRLALAAAGVLAALGLVVVGPGTTPAAQAAEPSGTLVFVRAGNIWLSEPDGTGQRQVTTGGNWTSASMSDNGRLAGIRAGNIVIMRPDGSRITEWDPEDLFGPNSCATVYTSPPGGLVISPDGTHVAWHQGRSSNCAGRLEIDFATATSDALRFDLGALVIGAEPKWIDSRRLTIDDHGARLITVSQTSALGKEWFSSSDYYEDDPDDWFDFAPEMWDPVVSRDGKRVAYVWRTDPETIWDRATTDNPLSVTQPRIPSKNNVCVAQADKRSDDELVLSDPMFSPDGDAIVHLEASDVWTISGVASGSAGCETRTFKKVLTNVTEVFWSAAEPDIAKPTVRITGLTVKHAKRKATVSFTGSDDRTAKSAIKFKCKLDKGKKGACTSPKTYKRLKPGRHTVRIWAVDAAGNTSAAAVREFRVRR
jgi:hypothetical protein